MKKQDVEKGFFKSKTILLLSFNKDDFGIKYPTKVDMY